MRFVCIVSACFMKRVRELVRKFDMTGMEIKARAGLIRVASVH